MAARFDNFLLERWNVFQVDWFMVVGWNTIDGCGNYIVFYFLVHDYKVAKRLDEEWSTIAPLVSIRCGFRLGGERFDS